MPEQLPLPLVWPSVRLRRCELCGREQGQINSPICNACRYQSSKHPCAIPDCPRLVAPDSTTCLWHRTLQVRQPRPVYSQCTECTAEMTPSTIPACATCRKQTYYLCACGCGRYRRKYDGKGRIRLYVNGHNDIWANRRRPAIACPVCQTPFQPKTRRQRLCSIACRSLWTALNPPHAHKRVLVECAVCGTQIARKLSQVRSGQDAACSPRCRYILVANKLRGCNISEPKRLALRRDGAYCRICGFDTMVEVHHIIPRRHKGPDTLDNLITLCPNHHTMADQLAHGLVTERLAACVNVMPHVRSTYVWQGTLERTEEVLMLIKTRRSRYAAVEQFIGTHHPYDTPEIVEIRTGQVTQPYWQWVLQETTDG